MSIPNTKPLERRPIHPGEILREDFLPEYDLSVTALAEALGVSRQSVNELLRERRAVSPEMALRLGKLFGTSPEFWLNLQRNVDLWDAARGLKREIAHIHPLQVAYRLRESGFRTPTHGSFMMRCLNFRPKSLACRIMDVPSKVRLQGRA